MGSEGLPLLPIDGPKLRKGRWKYGKGCKETQ